MAIFKKFKRRPGQQHLVSLDIGTEYVKTLLCRVDGDKANVVGVGRQHQKLSDMHGGAVTDIAGVVENCDAALRQAEEMAGAVAKDAVMGIAGELVKGGSTTIRYSRKSATEPITQEEMRKIIDKAQERAFERARSYIAFETGQKQIDVQMVNAAIVDVMIDGYRVTNPIGFQGRDIVLQMFNAYAPMVHIGALQSVASHLDLNIINIAAEPFAVAKSVSEEGSGDFSAIFIDIGGGTTDIALVNNGGVEGTKMFAIGGRSFTKQIANHTGLTFEKAELLKIKYSKGLVQTEHARKETAAAIAANIDTWLAGVELSLSEFDRVDHLPTKILLCGGGTGLPEIVQALRGDEWYKSLPFARKPIVSHIKPSEVNRVIDRTGQLTSFADITPMGLANVGLDTINSGTITDTLLDKLSKTLNT